LGAELILSHHPLLFHPVKTIDPAQTTGAQIIDLIRSGLSLYSAHTSFDAAEGGMNDTLAELCGLMDIKPFIADEAEANPIARKGIFYPKATFEAVCRKVEIALNMAGRLRTVGRPDAVIETAAVCGGAGGSYLPAVIAQKIDLYITSDVNHDQALLAKEKNICLIDGGHYGTEHSFIRIASNHLRTAFAGDLGVTETSVSTDPFL
jgi:dinuclear metal center YbgI/SA1388 family protein